jgi:hypothetical protein
MFSGMNDSEYFQSSRPGLEDAVEGRSDPLATYTELGEAVVALYRDTAREIGVAFPYSVGSGTLDARAEALRQIVRKNGVALTEKRAEKKMEEVYTALKTKVMPKLSASWDAQDLIAVNAVRRRLYTMRTSLLKMEQINAVILKVYGALVGFMAKKLPPPFGKVLSKYEQWFAATASKSIEDQLAAVNAEIPKVEELHRQIIAARQSRMAAGLRLGTARSVGTYVLWGLLALTVVGGAVWYVTSDDG